MANHTARVLPLRRVADGRFDPKCPCCRRIAADARMTEAKLHQSESLRHSLARVVRSLAPEHPVLESVFVEAADA